MDLRLYDNLTTGKRAFAPLDAANVQMYVGGVTVYDCAHIGNALLAIIFDVPSRLPRHLHGETGVMLKAGKPVTTWEIAR
jgi:cysteinyl-tRNA synthetase